MVQTWEGVNFSEEVLRDQMRYGRIRGLIRKSMPIGLRPVYIRRLDKGQHKRITINFTPSNSKFINQHTFLGLLLNMPQTNVSTSMDASIHQPINQGDITADSQLLIVAVHVQYDERNPDFHMGKV